MSVLTLQSSPGFTDVQDSALVANSPAYGFKLAQISDNAAFGMCGLEVFVGDYKHGDTVLLPVSATDGYVYSRSELLYVWTVLNSVNPQSGWISAVDSLWFTNWNVDQTTGVVFSEEWYRRSGNHANPTKTNDGTLRVFTIAQRRMGGITIAGGASYTTIGSWIGADNPYSQQLAQALNHDAKFAVASTEVFYMGEFVNGNTVPRPTSPIDSYLYGYSEIQFMFSWRWTTLNSAYVQPPITTWPFVNIEQLGPFFASINAANGAVSVSVDFIYNGGQNLTNLTNYGRIAVFAFCRRSATPGSLPSSTSFTEIIPDTFFPGQPLEYPTLNTLKSNIYEAILTPEFFGPTVYANGNTVSLPTSPVDGYTYARSELLYVWSWSDTTNQSGSHLRLPLFYGSVDPTTGVVSLFTWRLPPGGPYVDDDNTKCRITVITIGVRQRAISTPAASTPTSPTNASSYVADSNPTAIQVNGTAVPDIANFNDTLPATTVGVNV